MTTVRVTNPLQSRATIRPVNSRSRITEPAATDDIVVVPGRDGKDGIGADYPGLQPFEYQMPVAQTTATFAHTLGRDPVAVQVFVDNALCDEYTVVFPEPGHVVRVGFDISVAAKIRIF